MAYRISNNSYIISSIRQTAETEMERRWAALLKEMEKEGLDCLLAFNGMELFQGAARYITDIPYTHYPYAALLGKDGVSYVANGTTRNGPAIRNYMNWYDIKGITFSAGQPGLPSMCFANNWMPEKLAESIRKSGYKRIGLAECNCIPTGIVQYLEAHISGLEFVDAGALVSQVMAVKSDYEIQELYLPCVEMHDRILTFVENILRPGRSCHDVSRDIRELCVKSDIIHMLVFVDAHPTSPEIVPYHYNNYVIQPDDMVQILIELCSPAGIWGEVSRMYCFGEPNQATRQCAADGFDIQQEVAKFAIPGVTASELFRFKDELLIKRGYEPDLCFDIHASGYSAIERPVGIAEDDIVLKENMFLAIHPTCENKSGKAFCCDNYLITSDGGKRLNKVPSEVISIRL